MKRELFDYCGSAPTLLVNLSISDYKWNWVQFSNSILE